MKTEKNILIAFILNLSFSVLEIFGGIFTGSVAILSDALHDLGDAMSIGMSYFLEKKSRKSADGRYTYGYGRFSVLGSIITTLILITGSFFVILNAVQRILEPKLLKYDGMILFAVVGVLVNSLAVFFTREKGSLNQKAVNLHMLEDVLGWIVVLIGALVMKFTDFVFIDPIMSIAVSLFMMGNAVVTLKQAVEILMEKVPDYIEVDEIMTHLSEIYGVTDIHHIHTWSRDGRYNYATMHVIADGDAADIKRQIRKVLKEFGIFHVTIELETAGQGDIETVCPEDLPNSCHSHTHHQHHNHS